MMLCSMGCLQPERATHCLRLSVRASHKQHKLPPPPARRPQVSFKDVNLTLFPSPICSPDVVAGRIRQLQLFTGLGNSSVWGEGLIGHFYNFRQGAQPGGASRKGVRRRLKGGIGMWGYRRGRGVAGRV